MRDYSPRRRSPSPPRRPRGRLSPEPRHVSSRSEQDRYDNRYDRPRQAPARSSPPPAAVDADAPCVHANGLSKNVAPRHLTEIFGAYGEIEKVNLLVHQKSGESRGEAYILFAPALRRGDVNPAKRAASHMDGGQIDGGIIRVEVSVFPRSSFGGGGRGDAHDDKARGGRDDRYRDRASDRDRDRDDDRDRDRDRDRYRERERDISPVRSNRRDDYDSRGGGRRDDPDDRSYSRRDASPPPRRRDPSPVRSVRGGFGNGSAGRGGGDFARHDRPPSYAAPRDRDNYDRDAGDRDSRYGGGRGNDYNDPRDDRNGAEATRRPPKLTGTNAGATDSGWGAKARVQSGSYQDERSRDDRGFGGGNDSRGPPGGGGGGWGGAGVGADDRSYGRDDRQPRYDGDSWGNRNQSGDESYARGPPKLTGSNGGAAGGAGWGNKHPGGDRDSPSKGYSGGWGGNDVADSAPRGPKAGGRGDTSFDVAGDDRNSRRSGGWGNAAEGSGNRDDSIARKDEGGWGSGAQANDAPRQEAGGDGPKGLQGGWGGLF